MQRTAEKRFVRHVCPRNPWLLILLWNLNLHSLPEAWVPESGSTFASSAFRWGCIMPIPSLQLQEEIEKTCLMQRSRGFCHGVVVSKICYNAVIVLSVVLCDCCKPMNSCRDWAFTNSGLEVGLPFSCRCSQNVTHCRKEICSTCLSKKSMPFDPFVKSKPPLPCQKRLEFPRAAVRSPALHFVEVASCPSLRCSCRKR